MAYRNQNVDSKTDKPIVFYKRWHSIISAKLSSVKEDKKYKGKMKTVKRLCIAAIVGAVLFFVFFVASKIDNAHDKRIKTERNLVVFNNTCWIGNGYMTVEEGVYNNFWNGRLSFVDVKGNKVNLPKNNTSVVRAEDEQELNDIVKREMPGLDLTKCVR